jgi:hypothetical protein
MKGFLTFRGVNVVVPIRNVFSDKEESIYEKR